MKILLGSWSYDTNWSEWEGDIDSYIVDLMISNSFHKLKEGHISEMEHPIGLGKQKKWRPVLVCT